MTQWIQFTITVLIGFFIGFRMSKWNEKRKEAKKDWMTKYFENIDKTNNDLN